MRHLFSGCVIASLLTLFTLCVGQQDRGCRGALRIETWHGRTEISWATFFWTVQCVVRR